MKSEVRKAIEKILGVKRGYTFIDKRANGHYRMKISTKPVTPLQKQKILALPHVVKVGHTNGVHSVCGHNFPGVTIFFDCRPRDIELSPSARIEFIGVGSKYKPGRADGLFGFLDKHKLTEEELKDTSYITDIISNWQDYGGNSFSIFDEYKLAELYYAYKTI
jgi:hypothetical protein